MSEQLIQVDSDILTRVICRIYNKQSYKRINKRGGFRIDYDMSTITDMRYKKNAYSYQCVKCGKIYPYKINAQECDLVHTKTVQFEELKRLVLKNGVAILREQIINHINNEYTRNGYLIKWKNNELKKWSKLTDYVINTLVDQQSYYLDGLVIHEIDENIKTLFPEEKAQIKEIINGVVRENILNGITI